MDAIGGQEMVMPVIHPAEIWEATGRYPLAEQFCLEDRAGRAMVLGITEEEIITWHAAREIRSYRDLPQIWYQIHTKLRDEPRPKSGMLRVREFIMKTLPLTARGPTRLRGHAGLTADHGPLRPPGKRSRATLG
jgi:prolyl-tRNA synthetase